MMMKKGFTLIELLVVVGIMAFLGVAATGGYNALQRGMAENGATQVASSILRSAKERALVDRVPTMVFCYNRLIREADSDNNAIAVGEIVAIRRSGRITWTQGKYLVDEFADLAGSYDIMTPNEQQSADCKGMRMWRFEDRKMSAMKYSIVADAVSWQQINGFTYGGWADGNPAGNSNLTLNVLAYYEKDSVGGPRWSVGAGYGFEFASVQLPHNFVFEGSVPTTLNQLPLAKAVYFDPYAIQDDDVNVFFCMPDASGNPKLHHKAGQASSGG